MKTQLIILASIIAFLSSCSSSKSTYTFVPKTDQNILWRNGESSVSDTASGLYCLINSPQVKKEKLNFNMYFHNESNEVMLIDPTTFYTYQTLGSGQVKGTYALTPELLLKEYNQQVSSRKGLIIFAALAAVAVGVAVMAVSSKNKKEETPQERNEREKEEQLDRIERNQREQIALERSKQQSQSSSCESSPSDPSSSEQRELELLQQSMLRKHSLLPDESISGLVIFPMLYDVNKVELFVPIDSAKMKFSYDVK